MFGTYFDPNAAYSRDTAGATFDRATVLANTRKYVCGKVRREPLPMRLHIHLVKDCGAIGSASTAFARWQATVARTSPSP